VIKFLTLGKVGQGYGSKMEWVEQEKINPKFVNLADHRS
jgi:hypothetical protein